MRKKEGTQYGKERYARGNVGRRQTKTGGEKGDKQREKLRIKRKLRGDVDSDNNHTRMQKRKKK